MEDKYYTPETWEFCEGFEFEANYVNEGWQKEVFGGPKRTDISSVPQLLVQFLQGLPLEGNIRVPRLQREDFFDFDFDYKQKNPWQEIPDKDPQWLVKELPETYKFHDYCEVWWLYGNEGMRITVYPEGLEQKSSVPIFIGSLKNKLELKKLLTQLGVI